MYNWCEKCYGKKPRLFIRDIATPTVPIKLCEDCAFKQGYVWDEGAKTAEQWEREYGEHK